MPGVPGPKVENMPSYTQLLAQAQQLLSRGKLADAELLFKQVLTLRSRTTDPMIGLGLIYNATARHRDAADILQTAAQIQPSSIGVWVNLGAACHQLDRFNEAIRAFRRGLAYQPENPTILYNLGSSLKRAGQLEEAITAFRRAIELKPDYADALYNLGNTFREQMKPD